jgi:selenocysteine-specific elongation factor
MQFPLVEEVRAKLSLSEKDLKGLLGEAKSSGEIALMGENMILSRSQEEFVLEALGEFTEAFTLSEVRDKFESSRKYMLPLLEYLDSRGYTRRVGDKRILRKRSRES